MSGRSVVLFLFMTRRRRHAATTPARKSRSSRRGRQRAGAADPDPPGYHVAPRYCVTLWTRAPAAECDVMETKRAECTKVASSLRLRITFFCYIWRFIIFILYCIYCLSAKYYGRGPDRTGLTHALRKGVISNDLE